MEFINGELDGDSWEDLCDKCFRLRYQTEGYQRVPAVIKGDFGIEGFTTTGIVFQCYFPEREYSDDELYNHHRNKVTRDINKLINNGKELKSIGVLNIKEWHFTTPLYKDKRILQHCETKRQEVLAAKRTDGLDYIDDNFKILVKVERDYMREINRLLYLYKDFKLDLALKHTSDIDWTKCPADKVNNIKRKISAIMPDSGDSTWRDRYDRTVNIYLSYYIKGIELLGKLKIENPEFYERIFQLENACKIEMQQKCDMNDDSAINKKLFFEVLENFESKIKDEFGEQITLASIGELKTELVSTWLADCSMDFRGGTW